MEQLIQYGVYLLIGIGGWIVRELWSAVKDLREDMSTLREHVGKNYMPRDEIRELFHSIMDELRALRTDIAKKADK
jgi:hypothetical protein